MKDTINLYDATSIDSLTWPSGVEGDYAKKYLTPLIKDGVKHYLKNVDTELKVLTIRGMVIPITINDAQYENSYVCSPYSQYVSSGLFVIEKMKNKFLRMILTSIVKILGLMMRTGKINKVITVNNWLYTTCPPISIDSDIARLIKDYLTKHYPEHAILFRTIDQHTGGPCYDALKSSGFKFIPSRHIYLTQGNDAAIFQTRVFKSDLKFLKESNCGIIKGQDIPESEISKIQDLYNSLYVDKYSSLSPQFTKHFIKLALDQQILHMQAIKQNDNLEGVVGHFCQNGVMISPFFGYDPIKSEKKGVYRILSTLLMIEAQKEQKVFNQGAGGSFYKKIRRANGLLEYNAVYSRHLTFARQLPWWTLGVALKSIGIHFMKKY